MHLTLGAPATRTLKRQLTVWFRSQIHPDSLLTFAARSDIGGGLILRAGSRVYDFSFRSKILENKSRIMELANV
jgi:F0F1-type ATP synthase delta subunit